jgi:hypothetical protein
MLQKVKALKDGVVIGGDGRHDSMGHSAKYCAYTILYGTIPMIIHFDIVQVFRFRPTGRALWPHVTGRQLFTKLYIFCFALEKPSRE